MKSDGILAIHISNLHFDLRPVVRGLAEQLQWHVVGIQSDENKSLGTNVSQWALLSPQPVDKTVVENAEELFEIGNKSIRWSDEWTNLLSVLR